MQVLLLDADGVVLKKDEYFSEKFAREYRVPEEEVMKFFTGPFGACQAGSSDLKEEIAPYLEQWRWSEGVDAFLEYWFHDVVLDPEIVPALEQCKKAGIRTYMASNNEHYRARKIEAVLGDSLDGYFFSADLKAKKDDPAFFSTVLSELGVPADEVGFVDNEQKNVAAAESVGIDAQLYQPAVWAEWLQAFTKPEYTQELK